MVICLERGVDVHMAQLMPLPLTCFNKIQIGFTFLLPAYPGSPGTRAVKRVCVYVCVCVRYSAVSKIVLATPRPRSRPGQQHRSYVADDGQLNDGLEDREPDADVVASLGHRSARRTDELVRVETDLEPVVEQSEQRSQRERRHEDRYEAELQHCNRNRQ